MKVNEGIERRGSNGRVEKGNVRQLLYMYK
jgi:hypothetical protein